MRAKSITLIAAIGVVVFWSRPTTPVFAAQGEYPSCAPNDSCVIGEFLYDDTYAPIATATCSATIRNPNGSLFTNAATMTANSDGWYTYATSSASEGVYRTQVCCTTPDNDYLCLDKTFQIKSVLTASDVWNSPTRTLTSFGSLPQNVWEYSSRTLSGFGSLVADTWGYSSRSLTSFGNLVASIWDYGTRTITGGGDTVTNNYSTTNNNSGAVTNNISGAVTNNNISNISTSITNQLASLLSLTTENRQLLERLVNKPVVETFIDEGSPSLQSKIEKTRTSASLLYSNIQNLKSRGQLLDLKWDSLSLPEVQTELTTMNKILKEDSYKENSSLIASTDWLKNAWDDSLTLSLSDQAASTQSKIENLLANLSLFGKQKSPLAFKSALSHIENLDRLIGTSLDGEDKTTLYGYLKKIEILISTYNGQNDALKKTLAALDRYSAGQLEQTISALTNDILKSNRLPQADALLNPAVENPKTGPKNRIFSLLALVDANLSLLAGNAGKTVRGIWLEEGSVVFRTVISNPSRSISQTVPVELYLPEELAEEQIIKSSPDLKISFNTEKNRLWAVGQVELAPRESRTFFVETEDIWQYNQEEIDSLKRQTDLLLSTIKNTSFFAQGASLHSDIGVALDKIILRQKEAVTPENRIKTYRESRLEMIGVAQKTDALKLLVTQASASNSVFGFVGGVQAVAVWGLIIILSSGFVFLALYMRSLRLERPAPAAGPETKGDAARLPHFPHKHPRPTHPTARRLSLFFAAALVTSGFGAYTTSLAIKKSSSPYRLVSPLAVNTQGQTLGASAEAQKAELSVPAGQVVDIFLGPTADSPKIMSLNQSASVFVFSQRQDWAHIGFKEADRQESLWVNQKYLR